MDHAGIMEGSSRSQPAASGRWAADTESSSLKIGSSLLSLLTGSAPRESLAET